MNQFTYRNYTWLWKKLKQKYFPQPSIFLIKARYHVDHESGYHWTLGYRDSEDEARLLVSIYEAEVACARLMLKELNAAKHRAWAEYRKYEFKLYAEEGYYLKSYEERDKTQEEDPEYQRLQSAYREADDLLRKKIDEIMETMADQDIPFPYSHLVGKRGPDGPIQYYYEEVVQCRLMKV